MSESSVRSAARRAGLSLTKSRQRAHVPNLDNFGDYMLVDAATGFVIAGSRFDLSLEDAAKIIAQHSH